VVVSDKEDADICRHYHVGHVIQQNKPVTEKFNTAFAYMGNMGITNIMTLGSDDIISTEYLLKTVEQVNKGIDYVYTNSFYFYCAQGVDRGRLVKLTSRQKLGIGRTVSERILNQCDWCLWDVEKNWGMDAIASKNINKYAKTKVAIDGVIVDVKTRENMNSFRIWGNRLPEVPAKVFHDILSEEELLILKNL